MDPATKAAYAPIIALRTVPQQVGEPLLPVKNDGESSLSPVISPDGRYVAFFAARGLFGYDLYLADALTGKSIKRFGGMSAHRPSSTALSFISSAGTWSPDGRKFAFIVYQKGNQEIAILDVASRSVERQIAVPASARSRTRNGPPSTETASRSPGRTVESAIFTSTNFLFDQAKQLDA